MMNRLIKRKDARRRLNFNQKAETAAGISQKSILVWLGMAGFDFISRSFSLLTEAWDDVEAVPTTGCLLVPVRMLPSCCASASDGFLAPVHWRYWANYPRLFCRVCLLSAGPHMLMPEPRIIQGGMGVAVSGWRLAREVSRLGQLGVVSGTALAVVLSRRLQLGDPGGELRR